MYSNYGYYSHSSKEKKCHNLKKEDIRERGGRDREKERERILAVPHIEVAPISRLMKNTHTHAQKPSAELKLPLKLAKPCSTFAVVCACSWSSAGDCQVFRAMETPNTLGKQINFKIANEVTINKFFRISNINNLI